MLECPLLGTSCCQQETAVNWLQGSRQCSCFGHLCQKAPNTLVASCSQIRSWCGGYKTRVWLRELFGKSLWGQCKAFFSYYASLLSTSLFKLNHLKPVQDDAMDCAVHQRIVSLSLGNFYVQHCICDATEIIHTWMSASHAFNQQFLSLHSVIYDIHWAHSSFLIPQLPFEPFSVAKSNCKWLMGAGGTIINDWFFIIISLTSSIAGQRSSPISPILSCASCSHPIPTNDFNFATHLTFS